MFVAVVSVGCVGVLFLCFSAAVVRFVMHVGVVRCCFGWCFAVGWDLFVVSFGGVGWTFVGVGVYGWFVWVFFCFCVL